eukprot:g4535.t1
MVLWRPTRRSVAFRKGQLLLEAFRRYDRLEEGILCMKDVRSCLADIGIHPSLPPEKRAVTENGLDFYVIMTLVPKIWEAIATAKRQVSPKSSAKEIREAYLQGVRRYHPDVKGDQRKFQRLQEAYDVLGDPLRRRAYDQRDAEPGRGTASSAGGDPRSTRSKTSNAGESSGSRFLGSHAVTDVRMLNMPDIAACG